jgi:hypothetical protein
LTACKKYYLIEYAVISVRGERKNMSEVIRLTITTTTTTTTIIIFITITIMPAAAEATAKHITQSTITCVTNAAMHLVH